MASGGKRVGGGRKKGATNRLTRQARIEAAKTGELPHEWLLRISRGGAIKQHRLVVEYYKTGERRGKEKSRKWVEEDYYPLFTERLDAAKVAASYYAPRIAAVTPEGEAAKGVTIIIDGQDVGA